MPIRFRCAYCNQLMAISRRKVGTVVSCPKCAGELIVPDLEGTQPAEVPAPGQLGFDDPNFDAVLDEPYSANPTMKTPSGNGARPATEPMRSTASPLEAPARRGVFLPLGVLLMLIAFIVLLLVLAFVTGLWIGRSPDTTKIPPVESSQVLNHPVRFGSIE